MPEPCRRRNYAISAAWSATECQSPRLGTAASRAAVRLLGPHSEIESDAIRVRMMKSQSSFSIIGYGQRCDPCGRVPVAGQHDTINQMAWDGAPTPAVV